MSNSRSKNQQDNLDQLSHAEWHAAWKKRRDARSARKQAHRKRREEYRQLHADEFENDPIIEKKIEKKSDGLEILTPIHMKHTETAPIQKNNAKETLWHKILSWAWAVLTFIPTYIYSYISRKYHEWQSRRHPAAQSTLPMQAPRQREVKPIVTNQLPFSTEELNRMYERAGVDISDTIPAAEEKQIATKFIPVPVPSPSSSLFNCFGCFFHKTAPSLPESKSVDFQSRRHGR